MILISVCTLPMWMVDVKNPSYSLSLCTLYKEKNESSNAKFASEGFISLQQNLDIGHIHEVPHYIRVLFKREI